MSEPAKQSLSSHDRRQFTDKPTVIFLLGPTASGKTDVGIALAQATPCQLISVDSSLVYRGMDIGTAKPSANEQRLAPHKLLDICDPWEIYSAAQFCHDAKREIKSAHSNGKTPVLIGGTMLYFKALEHGLARMPDADQTVRDALLARAQSEGWEALHQQLAEIDPEAAHRIHPNDPQRIQRALEVWQLSGKTITEWQRTDTQGQLEYPMIKFGLHPLNRKQLHQRIEKRFDTMLAMGFLEEVARLKSHDRIHSSLPSMRSVGYRQAWQHLDGGTNSTQFRDSAVAATRQLAKRQLTWMRGMQSVHQVDSLSETVDSVVCRLQQLISERPEADDPL